MFIHAAIPPYDLNDVKVPALAYFKVMGIMGGRDFQGAGTKAHIHIVVKDDRNASVHQGEYNCFPIQSAIPFVVRIYRHGRITEHGLGTCGRYNNAAISFLKGIPDVIQMPVMVLMLHFQV